MVDKININDYFKKTEISGQVCNSPEDNETREKINQEMELVKRIANEKFNQSRIFASRLTLRSNMRGN